MQTRTSWPHALLLTAALSFLASAPVAQVTGVSGVNDYTVTGWSGGGSSGSTSCTALTGASGANLNFAVTAAPNTPVFYLFSTCPCSPNYLPFGTTCTGPSAYQSLDLDVSSSCTLIVVAGRTDASGVSSFVVPLPTCSGFVIATQAAVLDFTCTLSLGLRFTQAYDIWC